MKAAGASLPESSRHSHINTEALSVKHQNEVPSSRDMKTKRRKRSTRRSEQQSKNNKSPSSRSSSRKSIQQSTPTTTASLTTIIQEDVMDVTPSTVTQKRVDDGNADLDLLHHSKGRLTPSIIVPSDFHDSVMSFDSFPDWGLANDEKKNDLSLSSFPESPQQPPRSQQPLWISPRRTLSFPTIMEEETDIEIDNNDDHHHNDDDDDDP
jgi:hypothetical protein